MKFTILHLITSLMLGGAESALVNFLSTAVHHNEFEHHVAYFHAGPNVEKIQKLGVPTHHIKGLLNCYDPVAMFRLYSLISMLKPNVLHTALWSSNVIGRIMGQMFSIPVVSDLHGLPSDEGSLRNWVEQKTAHLSSRIVAVGELVKVDYVSTIVHSISNQKKRQNVLAKMTVIKNGIDVDVIRTKATEQKLSRADLGLDDDDIVIGAVGRLEPIKSYDVLIKAFAEATKRKSHSLKLCLVGGGSQMTSLQHLAQELGVSQSVLFLGPRHPAYNLYPLFDIFTLSSQSEGLSIALLEALCFGVPIISTFNGKKHEVVRNKEHGLLVRYNDVDAYVEGLIEVCGNDGLRKKMKENNLELIKQYSIDRVVKGYEGIYRCLM